VGGTELVQLKMEPMNGPTLEAPRAITHSTAATTTTTTTESTHPNAYHHHTTHLNNINNGTATTASADLNIEQHHLHHQLTDNHDLPSKLLLVVDHMAKHFPKTVLENVNQLPLSPAITPPKSSSSSSTRPPTPPSTATPITQVTHLLLCDEEVPLDNSVGGEGRGGNCPPNLEKMVLGVLNNTLKSIVSSVSSE
jgi:hypothetical protein